MSIKSTLNMVKTFLYRIKQSTNIYNTLSEQLIMDLKDKSINDLNKFEHKTYSQYGEDGIIEEIFARIGVGSKYFIEIGSGSGLENNTINLLMEGWEGIWIDADPNYDKAYNKLFSNSLKQKTLKTSIQYISSKNINDTLKSLQPPSEVDLLSLDIDGNDYYIWNAMTEASPRVMIVEYNAIHSARSNFLQRESDSYWDGGNFYGVSLSKLNELATQKGYTLVACNLTGNNAFFVKTDLIGDKFMHAGNVEKLYQKARYYLTYYAGSRPSIGEWIG